jgi:hypothetical protein
MIRSYWIAVPALFTAFLMLLSCSSTPSGPRMGTPAYYWQAAKEVYMAGDYVKTVQHLDNLLATDNEYTAKALPWALVLKSGMAAGYMDVAANYEMGTHYNRVDTTAFRRQITESRQAAAQIAFAFAEDFGKLDKIKGDTIPLAFPYPRGNAAPVSQLVKVSSGQLLAAGELDTASQHARERGVLLAACSVAGAPDDSAKTEEILKTGTASVPRATFMMAMAQALFHNSQLYTGDKLDDPRKMEIFCQRAEDALKAVPESKETKALDRDIQAAMKKAKK